MATSWSGSDDDQVQERPYEHEVIDIDSLRKTAATLAKRGTRWTMFRVPQLMYQVNPLAYTPQFVSIGPFHRHNDSGIASSNHRNADLQAMEGHKRVFMLRLLERTKYPNQTFRECEDTVNGVIQTVRDCYYTELDISNELLAKIILVDACFLLEVFLTLSGITNRSVNQSVEELMLASDYKKIFNSSGLRRDLALLENQLPFFVLQYLFEVVRRHMSVPADMQKVTLDEIAFAVFKDDINGDHELFRLRTEDKHPACRHLLDLISNYARPLSSPPYPRHHLVSTSTRSCRRPARICLPSWFMNVGQTSQPDLPPHPPMSQLSPTVHLRNAKKLSEAGIYLEKAEESKLLLDIEFCNGIFRIPPLVINECTESLLRNLMAFEYSSCNPKDPANSHEYFASYVFLMERLVSHKEDLDIMENKGIIVNQMGGRDDAYKIFHNISQNFVLKNFYFSGLCSSIEAYLGSRKHRYLLELKRKHLKNPWTTLSVVGGTILLIFTAIQTVYTVLGYLHHY